MTPLPPAEKKKILLLEDHPLFRAMLAELIQKELGMTVCGQTDNIHEAMVLIEQTHPDMVVIDINLMGSSGLELIKDLTARRIGLPVLVLSMHEESLYAERALHAGAKGYISKQEMPEEVAVAIRTVMDGRIYVSRRVGEAMVEQQACGGQPSSATGMDLLSDRELEVFQLVGQGLTTREIATQIQLVASTVDSYRARIKQKLGLKNAAELYQRAGQWAAEAGT